MEDPEKLEGAVVTLVRLGVDDLDRLAEDFKKPELYTDAGLYHAPKASTLRGVIEDRDLFICDMIPEESNESLGYAAIVAYSGPPFAFIYFFDNDKIDGDLAQEAMLLLVHAFFRHTNEEELWTFYPHPVPDEIMDRLIEGGFDVWEGDIPGVDTEKFAGFMMERHTYDAYYADEEDEEAESFEDY